MNSFHILVAVEKKIKLYLSFKIYPQNLGWSNKMTDDV